MLNADVMLDRYLNEQGQLEADEEYLQSIMDELEPSYPELSGHALHAMAEKVALERDIEARGAQAETNKFNERYY